MTFKDMNGEYYHFHIRVFVMCLLEYGRNKLNWLLWIKINILVILKNNFSIQCFIFKYSYTIFSYDT